MNLNKKSQIKLAIIVVLILFLLVVAPLILSQGDSDTSENNVNIERGPYWDKICEGETCNLLV